MTDIHLLSPEPPRFPDAHLFRSGQGGHILVADGSRVFDVADDLYDQLERAGLEGRLGSLIERLGLRGEEALVDDRPPGEMAVRALSLAVAQSCNLACTYCYAQQGSFGAAASAMPLETALRSVDLLLHGTTPSERVNLAFLGGEPLANRKVLRAAAAYARDAADRRGQKITFSITTNGTLVTPEDAEFFEDYGFAVTLSMDGPAAVHDRLRPFRDGRGSFDRIVERIGHLIAVRRKMQVTARVTVTPANLDLPETLGALIALGLDGVGFSPTLASPNGAGEMDADALDTMLSAMIACGRMFEERILAGSAFPFSNMMTALFEIHRGTHRPYPCGAGAGYLGVSSSGALSACHRFVGNAAGDMGSLDSGIDQLRRQTWMADRHVHRQEPCASCWARYLCGGGCHHEVIARGRLACDFIRGWLDYCLGAYVRLTTARRALFDGGAFRAHV